MKNKLIITCLFYGLLSLKSAYSQDENLTKTEYHIIAEGTYSPIPELQIVCFNKFF